jgi:hypothetical protein
MSIVSRSWFVTTLAVLSVLYAIEPLLNSLPALLRMPLLAAASSTIREMSRNRDFAIGLCLPILWDILILVAGSALFFRKSWSQFLYIASALLATAQLLSGYKFTPLYYIARGEFRATSVISRALNWDLKILMAHADSIITAGNIVSTVIAWAAAVIVCMHFRATRDLTFGAADAYRRR